MLLHSYFAICLVRLCGWVLVYYIFFGTSSIVPSYFEDWESLWQSWTCMQDIYYSFDTGIYYKSVGCVASTSINTANQTSDILQHLMNNTFIMYCSCVNTTVEDKIKFRIPFRRTAIAPIKKQGGNGTLFRKKRPFCSTALPF